ncbi:MAG: hypothetical protein JXN62_00540 [Bacteroidales bacterium]|nr:hypothetical protein [Bacteroidales bacterium]
MDIPVRHQVPEKWAPYPDTATIALAGGKMLPTRGPKDQVLSYSLKE